MFRQFVPGVSNVDSECNLRMTMALHLTIGNKNYSSWSLRPWLALKTAGIPFEETVIPIYTPESKAKLLARSPGGKVPILQDGAVTVWESLAILEYVAEKFPGATLWPVDAAARAHARAIASEMHAGFVPLRKQCPMNMWRPPAKVALSPEAAADVARIDAMWADCRGRYASDGPFLFGRFSAADAMYAPVVSRFHTYEIDVGAASTAYMQAVMALPAWQEWHAAALQEEWVLKDFELDWPTVRRA
jgi:glutathione S-transferase